MKRTPEQRRAMKRPTHRYRHGNGRGNPFSGKNKAQRQRIQQGFNACSGSRTRSSATDNMAAQILSHFGL